MGLRYYNTGNSGLMPSVTTIIKQTEPQSQKIKFAERMKAFHKRKEIEFDDARNQAVTDALMAGDVDTAIQIASERYDPEDHKKTIEQSQQRGNVLHDLAFKYLLLPRYDRNEFEETHPIPEEFQGYWERLEPELRLLGNPILMEAPIVHNQLGYAGRIDNYCYASDNSTRLLVDYKTYKGWESVSKTGEVKRFDTWFLFKKQKKGNIYTWEFDKFSDNLQYASLQVTAYRLALESMGLEVDEIRILVINPNAVQRITIPKSCWDELEQIWKTKVVHFKQHKPTIDLDCDEIVGMANPGYTNDALLKDIGNERAIESLASLEFNLGLW